MKKKNILLVGLLCLSGVASAQHSNSKNVRPITVREIYDHPFWNPKLPVDERIDNLLSLMTVEEKITQMMNRSLSIDRLNIPAYNWWGEACHGLMGVSDVTVFPQAIALAATFDDNQVLKTYSMVSDEARGRFNSIPRDGEIGPYVSSIPNLTFWAPNVNLIRDPRWGRGQESFGEDPLLLSKMGVSVVVGMQGTDPNHFKTHACAKHYAVHSGPEPLRHEFNAVVSKRDLWESYLPAFKALVKEGNVQEVMCAYSAFDGKPCCSSGRLLIDILRERWGYEGIILTDCDAINDFYIPGRHETHKNAAEASVDAVLHGTDLECGRSYQSLNQALKDGLITELDIDVSLRRVLKGRFQLGLLDPDELSPYASIPGSVVDCQAHRDQALNMARSSQVLLKNNGLLPLSKELKNIAVVGPNIDDEIMMRGNYSGVPTHCTTILEGLKKAMPNANFIVEQGSGIENNYIEFSKNNQVMSNGEIGFSARYFNNQSFTGEPVKSIQVKNIDFQTEGGYGFGEGVPTSDFSAVYTAKYKADNSGELSFSVRGNNFIIKINGDSIGGFKPRPLSFTYTPGMKLTEDQRRELFSQSFRRPLTINHKVNKGEEYNIEIDYISATKGSVSNLMVNVNERKFTDFAAIKDKVKDADVIIYVGGITSSQEGEGHERATIELPEVQQSFLKAMHDTGKPVVYVNCSGSAIGFENVDSYYDALLQAWYPGQEGGEAVADILFGNYNPSGKLPVTFYKSTSQLPNFMDYEMTNRTYRYFNGVPQYAFGYGLSYTKFDFGQAKLSKNKIKAGESVKITIPVENVGGRDGAEVVQVYVKSLTNPDAPIKALKAFKRVEIKQGEKCKVTLTLTPDAFSYYNDKKDDLDVFTGDYQLLYGSSSRDQDLQALPIRVI